MFDHSSIRTLAAALVLIAAVTDLRSRRIPNWLTLSGLGAGLLLNSIVAGPAGLWNSLGGLALGFASYLSLYGLRAMGAGDVKLMAAVGAILGPASWLVVFIASAAAAGVLAIGMIVWKRRVQETLQNAIFILQELTRLRAPHVRHQHLDIRDPRAMNMPHAVAIAVGTAGCLMLAAI